MYYTFEQVKKIMEQENNWTLRSSRPAFTADVKSWNSMINCISLYYHPKTSNLKRWILFQKLKKNVLVQALEKTQKGLRVTVDGVTGEITPFTIKVEDKFCGNLDCYWNAKTVARFRFLDGLNVHAVCGIESAPVNNCIVGNCLHCVVEKNGIYNDMFRYCAVSKELYQKILCYQELTSVSGKQAYEDDKYRFHHVEYLPTKDINPNYYILARDEYMERIRAGVESKTGHMYAEVIDIPLPKPQNQNFRQESVRVEKKTKVQETVVEIERAK